MILCINHNKLAIKNGLSWIESSKPLPIVWAHLWSTTPNQETPPEKLIINTVKNNDNIKVPEYLSSGAQARDLIGTESAEKQSKGFTSVTQIDKKLN